MTARESLAREQETLRCGDIIAALGLLTHSPWHSEWTARDLLNWVFPPMLLGQYMLLREKGPTPGRPLAYASWAFVSDEVHQALRADVRALSVPEWQCGPNVWVIDFIAPFGHTRMVARALRQIAVANGLQDRKAHWKRRYLMPPRS